MTEVVAKRSEASARSESGIRVITGREENEMNRKLNVRLSARLIARPEWQGFGPPKTRDREETRT